MRVVCWIAYDLLCEALHRKWLLALAALMTGLLLVVAFALRLDVVDGALAASRLFGYALSPDMTAVDVSMRPAYRAMTYLFFYGGAACGIVGCSEFGPALLSPGRIEYLLSLPVRRWELLLGTFLGVMTLSIAGALYGSAGLVLILGVKTGSWTVRPVVAGLLACGAFAAIYGPMLTAAVFARSAAISGVVGGTVLVMGVIAGYREVLAGLFSAGAARAIFLACTAAFPGLSRLAESAADFAGSGRVHGFDLALQLLAALAFSAGSLAIGIWHFEGKDY